jgi:PTS system nitrogen regulatory IIA component
MFVTDMICSEGVSLVLPARTRQSVLSELVKLADQTGYLYDGEQLLQELQTREADCSTALSRGVAVPHARRPLPYATERSMLCMGRVSSGIGYGQADGGLTKLFFLLCYHEEAHHLRVLARLTRMLDNETIRRLLEAEAADEALSLLREREEQVVAQVPARNR